MRVLLDECVPWRLSRELIGHTVSTVQRQGWAGVKNGALLQRIVGAFDVFVTLDRGIAHQNELSGREFAVVVIRAPSNRLRTLLPLAPVIREGLASVTSGQVLYVGTWRT